MKRRGFARRRFNADFDTGGVLLRHCTLRAEDDVQIRLEIEARFTLYISFHLTKQRPKLCEI